MEDFQDRIDSWLEHYLTLRISQDMKSKYCDEAYLVHNKPYKKYIKFRKLYYLRLFAPVVSHLRVPTILLS